MYILQDKRILKLSVFFLFLIAIGLAGYFFATDKNKKEIRTDAMNENVVEKKSISENERRNLLETPLSDIKEEEKSDYDNLLNKVAVSTTELKIGKNCDMDPLVMKFKNGDKLSIINNDNIDHIVAFENQNFFSVSSGDTREIDINEVFGLKDGIFRYRCSDVSSEANVGIFYITTQ